METQKDSKWVFKVIWAWQDELEEKWLEECATEGWHLEQVAPFFYKFRRGEPARVVYRMDYKRTIDKDYAEYRDIFKACGWELVAEMANWHYFRILPENAEVPEIYNDDRSRAQKYRRVLLALVPVSVIFITVFNPALSRGLQNARYQGMEWVYGAAIAFRVVILLLLIYGIIRILVKIRQLESGKKK
jgi:hypothetical protein